MKKLNKMPRFSYDDGKVLAYDVETSWFEDPDSCVGGTDFSTGRPLRWCDFFCEHDPFGYADCSVGSVERRCLGADCR